MSTKITLNFVRWYVVVLLLASLVQTNLIEINSVISLTEASNDEECLFDCDYLETGAAKDAIRSIDNPKFVSSTSDKVPEDNTRVIGIVINGIPRA